MELIRRADWNARKARATLTVMSKKPKGVKIHYMGSKVDAKIVDDHSICIRLVKSVQNQHMDANGWLDIGYSFIVCPHRYVFEGRGIGNLPAANGAGLNSGHYAILTLVGTSGFKKPNDEIYEGIWDCIDYIREKTLTGREIKGHKDGYATSCPGTDIYNWIQKGAKDIRRDCNS